MKRLKIKIKKAYANENVKTTFLLRVKPSMEG
jgi:putative transposon-encoded protein